MTSLGGFLRIVIGLVIGVSMAFGGNGDEPENHTWYSGVDLDHTSFTPLRDRKPNTPRFKVILGQGRKGELAYFRVTDHVAVLYRFLRSKGVASVYSGGTTERNVTTTRQIETDNGVFLYDELGSKQLLSAEQMVPFPEPVDGREHKFRDYHKKDLIRLAHRKSYTSLARTLMIDDDPAATLEAQRDHVISLYPTYEFYESYADVEAELKTRPATEFDPPSEFAFILERNKLLYALGFADAVMDIAEKTGQDVGQVIVKLTTVNGKRVNRDHPSQYEYYSRGEEIARAMGDADEGLPVTPAIQQQIACGRISEL